MGEQAENAIQEAEIAYKETQVHDAYAKETILDQLTELTVNGGGQRDQMERDLQWNRDKNNNLTNRLDLISLERNAANEGHRTAVDNKSNIEGKKLDIERNLKETNVALDKAEERLNRFLINLSKEESTDEFDTQMTKIRQGRVDNAKSCHETLRLKSKGLLDELTSADTELNKAGENAGRLGQVVDNLNNEEARVSNERDKIRQEIEELENSIKIVTAARARFGHENLEEIMVNADVIRLERYNKEIQRQNKIIDDLDRENIGLNKKVKSLEDNISKNTKELNNVRAELNKNTNTKQEESVNHKFDELNEREEALRRELISLSNIKNSTLKRIAHAKDSKLQVTQELRKSEREKDKELEKQKKQNVARNMELNWHQETQMREMEEHIKELTEKLDEAKRGSEEDKAKAAQQAKKYCDEWEAQAKADWKARAKKGDAWTAEPLYAPYIDKRVKELRKVAASMIAHAEAKAAQAQKEAEKTNKELRDELVNAKQEAEEAKEENQKLKAAMAKAKEEADSKAKKEADKLRAELAAEKQKSADLAAQIAAAGRVVRINQ